GTPAWMAPEQARGGTESLDERTDVHALGAILFFLLTGEPPSRAETPAEALAAFEAAGPPSPRRRDPSVPRPLDAVCRRAMALDPRDRYAGAAELGRELDLYLEGLPPESYREGPLERAGRWARKYRTAILLVAAYLVMRVALILWTGR
ncbi:MAG TPA: hypothetical protein VNI57_09270, partial [Candidatus Saccharimonadales bacterium]|nr:hypothetical protein [Candidatus Saccharimonadales bacterium]